MRYYMKSTRSDYDAKAESDNMKDITVLKGSRIATKEPKFRMMKEAINARNDHSLGDEDGLALKNIRFKSFSTAAQFVSASSKNGLSAWHEK